jgi:RNA-directed DNA polymerase
MTVPSLGRDTSEEQNTGAASHRTPWHQINWSRVQRQVRRLQARIVKAHQEGKPGKVKALQRLLTHSFSGKALAVRRVTENQGKRTAGVDGVTWQTPAQKAQALQALRQRGYHPRPLRRIYIPKANGKKRPLGIPTMQDRAMQALYLLALNPLAECTADPTSYGFRPHRCTADAVVYLHIVLSNAQGAPSWILEGDITSCFDRISHQWLLTHIPLERNILKKWLKAGYMENGGFQATEEGTPQGGIISPVLANMALDGLAGLLKTHFPSRKGNRPMVNLVRYADDFCITGRSQELLEQEVKPLVEAFLRERGLELSPTKTCITRIEEGIDFLGVTIRKYPNGVILTTPSKKNMHTFLEKIRTLFRRHKTMNAGALIVLLNPLIEGWARYHAFGASTHAYHTVDNAIYQCVRRWIHRRHPHQGIRWQMAKYFAPHNGWRWCFTGEWTKENGNRSQFFLRKAADMPIRRHVPIRKEANPFDPAWEPYFEKRSDATMVRTLAGKRQLLARWTAQQGRCFHCGYPITRETGWHSHHVIWRSKGGADTQENIRLVHPTCHTQIHSQGSSEGSRLTSAGLERLEPDVDERHLSGS